MCCLCLAYSLISSRDRMCRSTPESISVSTGSEELVQGVDPYPEQQYRLSIAWVYSALGDDLCDCLGAGLSSVPQSHWVPNECYKCTISHVQYPCSEHWVKDFLLVSPCGAQVGLLVLKFWCAALSTSSWCFDSLVLFPMPFWAMLMHSPMCALRLVVMMPERSFHVVQRKLICP